MADKNITVASKKNDIKNILNEIKKLGNTDLLFIKCSDGKLAVKTTNKVITEILENQK